MLEIWESSPGKWNRELLIFSSFILLLGQCVYWCPYQVLKTTGATVNKYFDTLTRKSKTTSLPYCRQYQRHCLKHQQHYLKRWWQCYLWPQHYQPYQPILIRKEINFVIWSYILIFTGHSELMIMWMESGNTAKSCIKFIKVLLFFWQCRKCKYDWREYA